ncbi:hypothetical protein, partial [Streptomyces sp. H27-D2]|uniref:hypothetical protein n=1 Tax=Streptomyces sp. H27-D2 TaxID=3046304 RepID=UPI002DB70557
MSEPTPGPDPEADEAPGTGTEPESEAEPGTGSAPGADAGPQPLGVLITPTGDAGVDAQLRRLADADHLAASGHLEVYEDV